MGARFVISDTHFGQDSMYRFLRPDGTRLRPWAEGAAEADEAMISAWNDVVRAGDTVYHVGDIVIARPALKLLARLNGRLVLIKGNHDIFGLKDYLPHVADIRAVQKHDDLQITHIPVHHDCIPGWAIANVHGHMHGGQVMRGGAPDTRYYNICTDAVLPAPIELGELRRRVIAHQAI